MSVLIINKLGRRSVVSFISKSFQVTPNRPITASSVKVQDEAIAYENARPYSEIPGPSVWELFKLFGPGGSLIGKSFLDVQREFLRRYGNVCKLPGILGKIDNVLIFEPEDMEKVFRNEGPYPKRVGFDTAEYFRKVVRKDIYQNSGGLGTEQGEAWWDFRKKVNPAMMMPKTTKMYVPKIDEISTDFLKRIDSTRGVDNSAPENFLTELNKWALESVCYLSLDMRIGLLGDKDNPVALKFMEDLKLFFDYSFQLDILPSIWKVYKTPTFKACMKLNNELIDTAMIFLQQGRVSLEKKKIEDPNFNDPNRVKGILEQLLEIDEKVALIMTVDSIIAGVDTTSSSFFQLLHAMALNPEKQEKLRAEIFTVLQEKDSKLTAENMVQMPYLRACLKESARLNPLSGNLRSAGVDMVLQGYQIPKDTSMSLVTPLQLRNDKQYPRSDKFIPERFLRSNNQQDATEGCPVGSAKDAHPFINLPFGFGPRMCIGRRLAELEMESLICRILRNYKVEWKGPPPTYMNGFALIPIGKTHFYFTDLEQ